jgi:diguanylate cyclase (GGDEF)-like protein
MPQATLEKPHGAELGEQLRRERLLDMENRLAPYRRAAFAVLGVGLLAAGPWLGWWWMAPLAAAAVAFSVVDRKLAKSAHPGAWVAAGWGVSPLMIAISTALTGAESSPAMYWFALPAVTLASRFERRGTILGGIYIGVLLIASTVPFDPAAVVDDPTPLIFAATLVAGTMLLAGAVVQSDREHRRSSVVDPLTGLLNRAALAQRVSEIGDGVGSDRPHPLGVLIGDLDHFKRINDEHGHAAGDAILRDVAYALAGALRSFDVAYRIGGEEFLVLLPDADEKGVALVGERLRATVAGLARPGFEITMSFGGAAARGPQIDFSQLSAAADSALYTAKREGRNRVCIAGDAELADAGRTPARTPVERELVTS